MSLHREMASPPGPDRSFINDYLTRGSTDKNPLEACKLVLKRLEEEMKPLVFQRDWFRSEILRLTAEEKAAKNKPIPVGRHLSDSGISVPPRNTGGRSVRTASLTGEEDVFDDKKSIQGARGRRQTWSYEVDDRDGRRAAGPKKYHYMFVVEATGTIYAAKDGFSSFTKGQKFDVLEETISTDGDDHERLYRVRDNEGAIGKVEQLFFLRCSDQEPLLSQKPWYHGTVPEATARKRLETQHCGCFLVKDSDSVIGSLEIVFKDEDDVYCIHVYANASGYSVLNRKFKTLDGVIDFHQKIPIRGDLVLSNPLLPKIQ